MGIVCSFYSALLYSIVVLRKVVIRKVKRCSRRPSRPHYRKAVSAHLVLRGYSRIDFSDNLRGVSTSTKRLI
jgi:hypothetical protein